MERYKKLVEDTYSELKNEEILGCYLIQHEEEGLFEKERKKFRERKK